MFSSYFILGLAVSTPTFTTPAQIESNNGSVLLEWQDDERMASYEVQQGDDEDFDDPRTIYHGHLPSAHVSGLLPGEYHFRLRAKNEAGDWSQWSPDAVVVVEYQPTWAVFTSLGVGAIVFFMTAGFVWSRSGRRGDEA